MAVYQGQALHRPIPHNLRLAWQWFKEKDCGKAQEQTRLRSVVVWWLCHECWSVKVPVGGVLLYLPYLHDVCVGANAVRLSKEQTLIITLFGRCNNYPTASTIQNNGKFWARANAVRPYRLFGRVCHAAKSLRSVLGITLCLVFTLFSFAHSSLLTPHSSLLIPNSSFLTPHFLHLYLNLTSV